MDKKIILSVLIVALIGIVAATYQINTGEEILNPLASVETEESPVTDVLTAPETQDDAQAQADAKAQEEAQAQAQAQAEADAQAQAQAQADADNQADTQDQATSTGSTSKRTSLVSSGSTITVPTTSGDGGSSSNGGSSSANDGGSSSNDGTNDNTGSSNVNNPSDSNTVDDDYKVESIPGDIISTLKSVLEPNIDTNTLVLDIDNGVLKDGVYEIPTKYKDTNTYAGKFFVKESNYDDWYYIDENNQMYTKETPIPGSPNLGQLDEEA